jgi:membrane-associated phospholipid phosphatase
MTHASILVSISFIDKIKTVDYWLFSKINGSWHNGFLDNLFPILREAYTWLPFYLFLLLFTIVNYRKKGLYWAICLIVIAGLSDFISSSIIKEHVFRLRPCHNPLLAEHIRVLAAYCPQSSSFTSSHATNHFAAAMFIFMTFRKAISKWWGVIFAWAALICYAQVYVGVHFPFDVFAGAILGASIGYFAAFLFNKKLGLQ